MYPTAQSVWNVSALSVQFCFHSRGFSLKYSATGIARLPWMELWSFSSNASALRHGSSAPSSGTNASTDATVSRMRQARSS